MAAPLWLALLSAAGCLAPEPLNRDTFLTAAPADAHLGRVELVFTEDETLERLWLPPLTGQGVGPGATHGLASLMAGLSALLEAAWAESSFQPAEVAVLDAAGKR